MWSIITGAAQGRGHIKTQTPCQDKVYSLFDKGVHVIALADGAGSAKLSHYGAQCVTHFICDEMCNNFDSIYSQTDGIKVKKDLLTAILGKLNDLKSELKCELSDLASTLLFVAVKQNAFILAHIGDGVIGYWKANEVKVASTPTNGEFANTTIFTTSSEALSSMKMIKGLLNDINGFILMSDGVAGSLYNHRKKTLSGIVGKIFQRCVLLPQSLIQNQLDSSLKETFVMNTMDDCSLAVIARPSDSFSGYESLSIPEKMDLFNINGFKSCKKSITRNKSNQRKFVCSCRIRSNLKRISKQLFCYESVLKAVQNRHCSKSLIRLSGIKKKIAWKVLQKLIDLNLVQNDNGLYFSNVRFSQRANEL